MSALFRPQSLHSFCAFVFLGANLVAQSSPSVGGVLVGSGSGSLSATRPSASTNGVFTAFQSIADALAAPAAAQPALTHPQLCSAYASKFLAAARTVSSLQRDLADPLITDISRAAIARRVSGALNSIRLGFEGIAADLGDAVIADDFSFWVASDGYAQLSGLLPNIHASYADTMLPALDASTALSNIVLALSPGSADPFDQYFTNLRALQQAQVRLADAVAVDPASPPPVAHPQTQCAYGQFRGCTNYRTITYTPLSCGAWGLVIGGITVDVEIGVQVSHNVETGVGIGTVICPNGGLWTRTCTVDACVIDKCVCECYASRWDRFWAINGTNKIVTIRDRGCHQETYTEYEWECVGAPPATLPVIPVWKGFGDEMDC